MGIPDATTFLNRLFAELETAPGQFDHLMLDHLCYRVRTQAEYDELRQSLAARNELLVESCVGGRPIATFRLREPIVSRGRVIDVLELPAPKPGRPYPTGFEHVEFVTDRPLPNFIDWLVKEQGVPEHLLDERGLAKQHNPDIRLVLPSGSSVKFHERPLAVIIAEELAATPSRR